MLSQYVLKFLYNKRSWKDMWNGFVLHHILDIRKIVFAIICI